MKAFDIFTQSLDIGIIPSDLSKIASNLIPTDVMAKAATIGRKVDLKSLFADSCISEEAISLATKMLEWDPDNRPSAEECLRHPFFFNYC